MSLPWDATESGISAIDVSFTMYSHTYYLHIYVQISTSYPWETFFCLPMLVCCFVILWMYCWCSQVCKLDISDNFEQNVSISKDSRSLGKSNFAECSKTRRHSRVFKSLTYDKLLNIATTYAELHPDEHYNNVTCPVPIFNSRALHGIIECPYCFSPRKATSSSAFLKLLQHFSRRHPQSLDTLAEIVSHSYGPYIQQMQNNVAIIARRRYKRKLRGKCRSCTGSY